MIDWLHQLPLALGAAVVAAAFLVPALIGSALLQPTVARLLRGERDPNGPVGLLLSSFTLYFGVLLALLSIAVFENYRKAQDAIGAEAAAISTLHRLVDGYPEPARTEIFGLLRAYIDEEAGPGWEAQRQARPSLPGTDIVDALGHTLLGFRPDRARGEDVMHGETLERFGNFIEARRTRIQAGETSIPRVMWFVVLSGAVLNVFVLWLFDLKRTTHLIIGGVLSAFIGLVIYLIAVLDQPFRGSHGLAPDDLIYARERMTDK
jgi:hypothetical protein